MSELTCHASEALNDIGHLGDILDALDCIPEDKADSEYLLRGAAAIGRRIVSLSIEASEQFELSANARCAREALSDLRGFGEIIAALELGSCVEERLRDAALRIGGARPLHRQHGD